MLLYDEAWVVADALVTPDQVIEVEPKVPFSTNAPAEL
jgi:hypothetical protein